MDDTRGLDAPLPESADDVDIAFSGNSEPKRGRKRAIRSDWRLHRMPRARSHLEIEIPLTNEEFEALAWGRIPQGMDDRWFMYFDGEAFCFHRSWTGYCIYRVYVRRDEEHDGYALRRVTANRNKKQYAEDNNERDAITIEILVGLELGRDVPSLWERHSDLAKK